MPDHPFKDNVVIVTGASRGIGKQLAYQAHPCKNLDALDILSYNKAVSHKKLCSWS
jgi:NAD(P)-dependent dehydrogenase (short-subunit alcohol dehydrogenase family)